MYKVFIVDDEEYVIKSLKGRVNWNEYGFEVVGYELNGEKAYEKIKDVKPDVVFVDIRIPGMTGLELIKEIKLISEKIIFIVISGYAEFAYAQKAMNYGALGYCLKPFDDDEIIAFLIKAKTILDNDKISTTVDILDLIDDDTHEAKDKLHQIFLRYGIDIKQKKLRILVSIGGKLDIDESNVSLILKIGYEKYAYFIVECEKENLTNFLNIVPKKNVKGIGLSKAIDSIEFIKEAITEAEINAYGYFTCCKKMEILYELSTSRDNDNFIIKLAEYLSSGNIPAAVVLLEDMVQLFSNGQLNIKHAILIYNYIISFLNGYKNEQCENCIYNFDELTKLFSNVEEMLFYLKGLILKELKPNYEYGTNKFISSTFKSILKFVNENFYDNNISIQTISKKFHINANYISQLFKKETGITFTEYISKLRIDYACKLLKTTDMSISEIAEKVGYNDYFYFSRIFKKIKGKSPGSFRKEMDYS